MSEVIQLFPNSDIPTGLRNIADDIESGKFISSDCTVILGLDVFHLGCIDDGEAAQQAIFNMTFGIYKLMRPVVDMDME